jgi:hypothetical protein
MIEYIIFLILNHEVENGKIKREKYQHIDIILKQVSIKTYLEMKGCAKIAQLMR